MAEAINGTNGNDKIRGSDTADNIIGGAGDDSMWGYEGDDTLEGGKGRDLLEGGDGADTFVYALGGGNDTITDYEEEDIIKFESGTPKITTKGKHVIFTVGVGSQKGTVTVLNAKDDKIITWIDSDGLVHEYPQTVKTNEKNTAVTLTSSYNKDSFDIVEYSEAHEHNYDNVTVIDASAVEQEIHVIGNGKANTITGGSQDDSIEGGKGNDVLSGGEGSDVFVYNKGDGNDKILDYTNDDTIQINDDYVKKITKSKDGKDYVITLNSKKTITLVDAADKIISWADSKGASVYPNVIDVNDKGTAVTLKAEYTADTFDVTTYADFSETARTIDASAVDQDIAIVGNKKNNVIIGADGNNTIEGGKGNDTLTGGSGKNVFVFNSGDGKNVITNYSSGDAIKVTSGTISASKSGSNYVLSFSGGGSVTLLNASKKYIKVVDDNGARYVPIDPLPVLKYSGENDGTVTIGKGYTDDTFDVNEFESDFAGKVFVINATAVKQDINIIGNKLANTITGSDQNDTIEGGKGNDVLTGGEGSDVFVYNVGDGNDKILDYENEDSIQIAGDTVTTISKSGDDYVMKLKSKQTITLVGAADKVISYEDDIGVHTYPELYEVTEKGKKVTLLDAYSADTFDVTTVADVGETARTIDASAVDQDLSIKGNAKNNVIIGSDGDNTIEGGKGKDTLTGGSGRNVFVFNSDDGSGNVITNYKVGDIIKATSGKVTGSSSGSDFVVNVGGAKVTLQGAAKKYVKGLDADGTLHWVGVSPMKKLTYDDKTNTVTIHNGYKYDTFNVNDFEGSFNGTVFNINASESKKKLTIVGNNLENEITGTSQNDYLDGGAGNDVLRGGSGADSLWGGEGSDNDTLYGGAGNDTFIYNPGEGDDVIADYAKGDRIMILSGDSYTREAVSGDDVTFTFSDGGQILVQGAADKAIKFVNSAGKTIDTYTP